MRRYDIACKFRGRKMTPKMIISEVRLTLRGIGVAENRIVQFTQEATDPYLSWEAFKKVINQWVRVV